MMLDTKPSKNSAKDQTPGDSTATDTFRFGIASIDNLLNDAPNELGYHTGGEPFVACISGVDGVGKSILALHAASTYAATCGAAADAPRIIYASTDLNFDQAHRSWKHFGLDKPKERANVLWKLDAHLSSSGTEIRDSGDTETGNSVASKHLKEGDSQLIWTSPLSIEECAKANRTQSTGESKIQSFSRTFGEERDTYSLGPQEVCFLDLARFSAGDDWGLINKAVGLLTDLGRPTSPHLLIVDAVEGLEAMVGERDAFGLRRSRRSRLAQLVRIARKVRCNVIFIIEQREDEQHLDEVFVSDLVIRVRSVPMDGYLRKTIEVEKARSVSHIRGQHDLYIRDGAGCPRDPSCPDDPRMEWVANSKAQSKDKGGTPSNKIKCNLAYMLTMPSLDVRPSSMAPDESPHPSDKELELPGQWFGIADLDKLLTADGEKKESRDVRERTLISLGDSGTMKSRLAYSFLAHAFPVTTRPIEGEKQDGDASKKIGGAILLTTEEVLVEHVRTAFGEWGRKLSENCSLLVVRPLPPRFMSSSAFLFRVRMCIREMKRRVAKIRDEKGTVLSAADSVCVRLVIDNWTSLLDSHPSLRQDSRLLQSLFRLIQEEGVSAFIVSTQDGSPNSAGRGDEPNELADLEVKKIFTWPVDFFGGRRIAVTTSRASTSQNRTLVYELLRDVEDLGNHYKLKVDRHFAVYRDLEKGTPQRIDLKVRLWSGDHAESERHLAEGDDYSREVSTLFGDLFPNSAETGEVVRFENIERYEGFKEYIQTLERSELNHTLVFQVDEFWTVEPDRNVLADLTEFLDDVTATWVPENECWKKNDDRDHEGEFQPHYEPENRRKPAEWKRRQCFSEVALKSAAVGSDNSGDAGETGPIGRIPLHRDFGFILADRNAWYSCRELSLPVDTVIFSRMTNPGRLDLESSLRGCFRQPFESEDIDDDVVADDSEYPLIDNEDELRSSASQFRNMGVPTDAAQNEANFEEKASSSDAPKLTVGDVWNSLCLLEDRFDRDHEAIPTAPSEKSTPHEPKLLVAPSWYTFLQACQTIEQRTRKPAFDVDFRTSESLSSIVMEIWFSMLIDSITRARSLSDEQIVALVNEREFSQKKNESSDSPQRPTVNDVRNFLQCLECQLLYVTGADRSVLKKAEMFSPKGTAPFSLKGWVRFAYPWLFYSLKLLIPHLPARFSDRDLQLSPAQIDCAAMRTWFATGILSQKENRNLTPLRIPGKVATRGDWHLGIAQSSRSILLAFRAMGKLCSKRMNLKRLTDGVGLPVREMQGHEFAETALTSPVPQTNDHRHVQYREVETLESGNCLVPSIEAGDFRFNRQLYRSRIRHYDRNSSEFFTLIERLLRELVPLEMSLEPRTVSYDVPLEAIVMANLTPDKSTVSGSTVSVGFPPDLAGETSRDMAIQLLCAVKEWTTGGVLDEKSRRSEQVGSLTEIENFTTLVGGYCQMAGS